MLSDQAVLVITGNFSIGLTIYPLFIHTERKTKVGVVMWIMKILDADTAK